MAPRPKKPKVTPEKAATPTKGENLEDLVLLGPQTNAAYYAKIDNAIDAIKSHPKLTDIDTCLPLTIAQGSTKAPFKFKNFVTNMKKGDNYESACPLLWVGRKKHQ